jgi:hypothetical protein
LLCLAILTLVLVSAAPARAEFGISDFDGSILNQDGTTASQAGSHPYEVSTTIRFNQTTDGHGEAIPDGGNVKDIEVELPPGFVGDSTAIPQCAPADFNKPVFGNAACPADTQIGVLSLSTAGGVFTEEPVPIFNLVPPPGQPAAFGFRVTFINTVLSAKVRTGSDNGITVDVTNIPQGFSILGIKLTFWGVPADHGHDNLRGECDEFGPTGNLCPSDVAPKPFLTLPTQCTPAGVGVQTTLSVDSWSAPGVFKHASFVSHLQPPAEGTQQGPTGCERVDFEPSFSVAPDTTQADTPAGLTVDVKTSQAGLVNPTGIAPADLRDTTVALPAGIVINPGQAAGLLACQAGQDGVGSEAPPSCPAGSKVGTVQITTPLLPDKLEGAVYLLQSNPPELQLLVAASADGVNLKLVGNVHLDESTGQLTATFENTPQLPFTDLKLALSGGAQAALATPASCGVYKTNADFAPWTAPLGADVLANNSFAVESGPGGSACDSTLPFSPSLIAGATTDQAGGFTSFSLLLSRGDGQQRVSSLQFKTPEGLLAMIRSLPLCGDAEAATGVCPVGTQIGHTVVQAGPGPYPLVVPQPGGPAAPIYLTGPYKGAPYGLAIAVPVVAGPFNLGTVVVRAAIAVDRTTSQLTITTDPLPSILDGVPTDLRTINAVIDRPGFMFNPTSCAKQSFSGTATSAEGATAAISTVFQVGSCQSLKFAPKFAVSTSGRTSRKNGASLDAKIVYPTGPVVDNQASQQANIAKVKVDLPKQLPSRLTTLQKACLAATFEANPGNCPAASIVGSGKAVTPVLGAPLNGPAYFVSHGGEAFPSLVVVLQGDGVRVDLTGSTFISKAGITSSTFKSVPDVPITSFELILPEGPHSALAANGNLCSSKLAMPTAFVGQNGAEIHESTKLSVTGCPKKRTKVKSKSKSKSKASTNSAKTKGTKAARAGEAARISKSAEPTRGM